MTVEHDLQPFVLSPSEAENYWTFGSLWSIMLPSNRTSGRFTLLDQLMPRGAGPGIHVHDRLHEYFFLIDGQIRFQINKTVTIASAGSAVSIPPGTPHAFVVVSDTTRALNMYTPGGFDDRLRMLATPATSRTLPPTGTIIDEVTAEQDTAFDAKLRELHNERFTDEVPDLLADDRDPEASPAAKGRTQQT